MGFVKVLSVVNGLMKRCGGEWDVLGNNLGVKGLLWQGSVPFITYCGNIIRQKYSMYKIFVVEDIRGGQEVFESSIWGREVIHGYIKHLWKGF